MKKIVFCSFLLAFTLALFQSCSQKTENRNKKDVDGGPCDYAIERYPAVIIRIDTISGEDYDLVLETGMSGEKDTTTYFQYNNSYLKAEEFKSSNLKLGDTITFEYYSIISGSCNPDYDFLTLEKYKKGK